MSAPVTRTELEDFLFLEAALLDNWQLDEWLALFVEGARYFIPPAGAEDDADPATSLFYVADDYHRLCERVKRLKKRTAHAEFPRSRCRRMVRRSAPLARPRASISSPSSRLPSRRSHSRPATSGRTSKPRRTTRRPPSPPAST